MDNLNYDNNEVVILYHADCLDGFGAAFAAWICFGLGATYIPVKYGQKPPEGLEGKNVYILDFSYSRPVIEDLYAKCATLRILDHHKSAKEDLGDLPYATFDMTKSGAILAWNYFNPDARIPQLFLHIQDHDLCLHRLTDTRPVVEAMYSTVPFEFSAWEKIIYPKGEFVSQVIQGLAHLGTVLLNIKAKKIKSFLEKAHPVNILGSQGLACNAPHEFASDLGHELAKLSGTYGAVYYFDGSDNTINYSLRSVGDFDVSIVAKRWHGGGGHKNAAGFRVGGFTFSYLDK